MKLIHYVEPIGFGNSYWWEDSERVPISPVFHTKFEAEAWHKNKYALFEAWLIREQEKN